MQSTRKRRGQELSPEHYALDNPFFGWYASYWKRDAATCVTKRDASGSTSGDIFMGELASTRFSLGVDDDRTPVLGIAEGDTESVMAVGWTGAAFLRRVQRRDWIALSCPDARIDAGGAPAPVPIRLWLPCAAGLLDAWVGADPVPGTLRIVEAAIRKGLAVPVSGPPLAELPLGFKGAWEAVAAAA